MKDVSSIIICLAIGKACSYFSLPLPAPVTLVGVLMVFAFYLGSKL